MATIEEFCGLQLVFQTMNQPYSKIFCGLCEDGGGVLHVLLVPIWVQRIHTWQVSDGFSGRNNSRDPFSKDKSFMYGHSVPNKRIEA